MALSVDRPFLISPPFGTYVSHKRAYSVLGSFTVEPRPGRLGQVLRTVRPVPGGWINAIGLRNPGMNSLPKRCRGDDQIISLAPLVSSDWHAIERWIDERFGCVTVEINVSCPNVNEHPNLPSVETLKRMFSQTTAIAKLPPYNWGTAATILFDAGFRYFHFSNTLPSPIGGISGRVLREVNLRVVERARNVLGSNVEIIAGGGIYEPKHLAAYRNAGATRFSLATAWFWPPRALRVIRSLEKGDSDER